MFFVAAGVRSRRAAGIDGAVGAGIGGAGTVALMSDERRAQLNALKLRALVAEHTGDEVDAASGFAPGAALVHGGAAWVLLDDDPARRLGAALAWALRSDAAALHVIAEAGTGVLARRAAEFAFPISVWHAEGRMLLQAVAEPFPDPPQLPAHHEQLRPLIEAGGATPLVENGVLVGEVAGLEVCRVVDDPYLDTTRLEVGVGAHDREAFQMLHGDVPAADSLERIVAAVAEHRRRGAGQHPLNRLASERFLRWRLERQPGLIGAVALAPAEPPVPRPNLKDPVPCVATGRSADGTALVVVCSTGVELDLVPYAADARLAVRETGAGEGRLVIVTPARDRLPVIERIAGLLRQPAELASLD